MGECEHELITASFDVTVCGGTLGIFLACVLQQAGWRVAVVERGDLAGRTQEWYVSRPELETLCRLKIISKEELEQCITVEYSPGRIGFGDSADLHLEVDGVLNVGVLPSTIIGIVKNSFLRLGGTLYERHQFEVADVYVDSTIITLKDLSSYSSGGAQGAGAVDTNFGQKGTLTDSVTTEKKLRSRILIDAMGNFSPITRQARGENCNFPDGVCITVGSCATANQEFPSNGDIIYSFTGIEKQLQYFWEAFPAQDGRTTYMFAYLDAHPDRPSLAEVFNDYLTLMPGYQNVRLEDLQLLRAFFGFFPCYKSSPVQPKFDRVFHFGDSSGLQSPLSFGGFGAMLRHLPRISGGLHSALRDSSDLLLSRKYLSMINPYQPALSVTWLFQRSMCVRVDQKISDAQLINRTLSTTFQGMKRMGDPVLKPFLQDVVQAGGLTKAMFAMTLADPALVLSVMRAVGPASIFEWFFHYLALVSYSVLCRVVAITNVRTFEAELPQVHSTSTPESVDDNSALKYTTLAVLDRWRYGSGRDVLEHSK
eukprot:CAMPEP_0182444604 /NCGR_PEP_ID=MMETSP1172-20130603/3005_1 /TAXON_ID=708627 /ORGANISM="Timspurckia oligopyrenoides, Strain CCMP3278" /LENGTH=537 /DNA_ID=CAMNT_0024640201 /DNA_START=471 /DNA_END=2084 /DNA_ORIENTATION=+